MREVVRALITRALPAMRSSFAVAITGVAAEYALRALVRYAMSIRAVERAAPTLTDVLPVVPTRVIVTEVIIRERVRRLR
jgi:hypothetical protein